VFFLCDHCVNFFFENLVIGFTQRTLSLAQRTQKKKAAFWGGLL